MSLKEKGNPGFPDGYSLKEPIPKWLPFRRSFAKNGDKNGKGEFNGRVFAIGQKQIFNLSPHQ
jgi:hypothetical protein